MPPLAIVDVARQGMQWLALEQAAPDPSPQAMRARLGCVSCQGLLEIVVEVGEIQCEDARGLNLVELGGQTLQGARRGYAWGLLELLEGRDVVVRLDMKRGVIRIYEPGL